MVKIRLRRTGAKKQPHYRVVVTDSRAPRDGKFIEIIGHYNPRTEPPTVEIDPERALYWLSVGAQPSEAVRRMLDKMGIMAQATAVRRGEVTVEEVAALLTPADEEPIAEEAEPVEAEVEVEVDEVPEAEVEAEEAEVEEEAEPADAEVEEVAEAEEAEVEEEPEEEVLEADAEPVEAEAETGAEEEALEEEDELQEKEEPANPEAKEDNDVTEDEK
jgi:small subunit ribosomal protein S16